MNTFKINKTVYTAKPFSFNCVCELEDLGVSLNDIQKKSMSLTRAYFAYCANLDKDSAGSEIEKHIMNKGKLDDLMLAMQKELESSDFFLALSETTEEKNPTTQKKSE